MSYESYETPRKSRLLNEALGDEKARLPSVAHTCWTIGLIAASLTIIALAGLDLPEYTATVPIVGQRHAELSLPIARTTITPGAHTDAAPTTAAETTAPAETGDVVDLTY